MTEIERHVDPIGPRSKADMEPIVVWDPVDDTTTLSTFRQKLISLERERNACGQFSDDDSTCEKAGEKASGGEKGKGTVKVGGGERGLSALRELLGGEDVMANAFGDADANFDINVSGGGGIVEVTLIGHDPVTGEVTHEIDFEIGVGDTLTDDDEDLIDELRTEMDELREELRDTDDEDEADELRGQIRELKSEVDDIRENSGGMEIHVGTMVVTEAYRKSSVAVDTLRGLHRLADQTKADAFSFTAGLDMGGYAWAKLGGVATDPETLARDMTNVLTAVDPEAVKERREAGLPRLDPTLELRPRGRAIAALPKEAREAVRRVVEKHKTDPKLPWRLAELRHDGKLIGPQLLRGSTWEAKFPMKDKEAKARFERLVYRKRTAA